MTAPWTPAGLAALLTGSGAPLRTRCPATDAPLATLAQSTADDVSTAFALARAAQRDWADLRATDRAKPFHRFAGLLLDRQDQVLDLIQLETGKARISAHEEVLDAALVTSHYARRAPRLLSPRRRAGPLPGLSRVREHRRPYGTVAVISPWNYPLALPVSDIVPALLAGNAVLHKPDEQTALTALWARALLIEAGLPEQLWQIVIGPRDEVGDALLERVDHVCLTGSTAAGRAIGARAGQRLIGCSLELGGKNAMLVLADADLAAASRAALRACFASAGQLCLSIERIYLHESVHDEFLARFLPMVGALRLGGELAYGPDIGSLTLPRQLRTTREHIADAVAGGATVLAGGRPRPELGPLFHEPTVLAGVTEQMIVHRAETFGPVVSVAAFRDEDEAVRLANDSEYGLSAAVFSRDVRRARRIAARIEAGTVNINDGYSAGYAAHDAPMGGWKASGLGRRHGDDGLLGFTQTQVVAGQRGISLDSALRLGQLRYTATLNFTVRAMRALRLR